jgi:hypothetical protein
VKKLTGANLKARAFLAAFRVTASITRAAEAAGIERDLHYRWLKDSKGYAAAFERAREEAGQTLEDEAVRRAHQGIFTPNIWKGQFAYAESDYIPDPETSSKKLKLYKLKEDAKPLGVVNYSDQLLMFILKGLKPDKYRERGLFEGKRGEPLAIAGTLAITVEQKNLKTLNDDELASLIAISQKFTAAEYDAGGTEAPQPE